MENWNWRKRVSSLWKWLNTFRKWWNLNVTRKDWPWNWNATPVWTQWWWGTKCGSTRFWSTWSATPSSSLTKARSKSLSESSRKGNSSKKANKQIKKKRKKEIKKKRNKEIKKKRKKEIKKRKKEIKKKRKKEIKKKDFDSSLKWKTLASAWPKNKSNSSASVSNKPLPKLLWSTEALVWAWTFPKTWSKCTAVLFKSKVKSTKVPISLSPFNMKKHLNNKLSIFNKKIWLNKTHIISKISKF